MMPHYVFLMALICITACTSFDGNSKETTYSSKSIEDGSAASDDHNLEGFSFIPISDFTFALPLPEDFQVSTHEQYDHIKFINIMNRTTNPIWPGTNTITLFQFAPNRYSDLHEYLDTICSDSEIFLSDTDRYKLIFTRKKASMIIYKIEHSCADPRGIYIPPLYTEYILIDGNNGYSITIDEEADENAMKRFEEMILQVRGFK